MQSSLMNLVVAAAPAAAGGGDDGQGSPILPHTGELVFGTIVFLAFLFLIWKYVVPRMETAYTERVEAIEGDMGRAEKALAEADELKQQYEAQLTEARAEANRMREQGREDGAAIVAEMRAQGTAEAQRIIEAANRQVEVERVTAFAQLKGEIGRMSTDLAGRIVGESLEDEVRQKGIVERFLTELEDGTLQRELGSGEEARPR